MVLSTYSLVEASGSNWTKLQTKLHLLKQFFLRNCYVENFVNKWVKTFMDNFLIVKGTTVTVGKKLLALVIPHLRIKSLIVVN